MAYVVLARKYRPQTFDEVVGQEAVARTLKNAIAAGRVAHAFLFSGPRGVGKTSLARILAKALNCEAGITTDPCGSCTSCIAVAEGRDLDVVEIDGASNNGVENVRQLRENSETLALRSRHKIYIIDEVHMLSKGAFNALLKTLEEPPPHVKFVLATTEPQKIPDTIHSRCQRYELREIGTADIVKRLEQICAAEGIEAADGVLDLIAQNVRGGMRDAQSALDQLRSYCGDSIDADSAVELLGIAGHEALCRLTDAVLQADVAAALEALHAVLGGRRSPSEVVGQWVEFLRELLIGATCGEAGEKLARRGTATAEEVAKLKDALSPEFGIYAIQLLAQTRSRMMRSMQAGVLLEVAVIKLCRTDAFKPLEEISRLAASAAGPASAPAPREHTVQEARPASYAPDSGDGDFWVRLKERVIQKCGPTLGSYLGEARLVAVSRQQVVLEMGNDFHREALLERESRRKIEACIESVAGSRRALKIEKGNGVEKEAVPKKEARAKSKAPAGRSMPVPSSVEDEGVKKAIEVFSGTLVRKEQMDSEKTQEA